MMENNFHRRGESVKLRQRESLMTKKFAESARKRIMIVDDHPMMRHGIAQLIGAEPDLSVCGEAENARDAFDVVGILKPDLVLADITLPGKNGLELLKDFQAILPHLPVLVVSTHDETFYAERVLRAGGRGYIMKQEGGVKLMQAIRQVLAGEIYVSAGIATGILETLSGRRTSPEGSEGSPMEKLTDREFEIFQLVGQGQGTKDIAHKLHLSAKTVDVHRANIKNKLKLASSPELIRYAVRWTESHAAR
jgi:DNA-binding NarL/FixJ family response regulator